MWELIPVSLVFCGSGLLAFWLWLERIHPKKEKFELLSDEWEKRFQKLKEVVDDLTMGSKLRHNNDEDL